MASRKKMSMLVIGLVIILLAIAGGAYYFAMHRANPPLPRDTVRIDGATLSVEIASTTLERMNGLSFRPSLGADDGMLFLFGSPAIQNFWMKDMNFPLDMIWIASGTVVGFVQDAVPQPGAALWSLKIYSSPDGTDKVLEVNAGMVAQYNIKIGDTVEIGPAQ